MTTRYERIKMQRRMQRRIRLVVEERRSSLALPPRHHREPTVESEPTVEITPRAVGRVSIPLI